MIAVDTNIIAYLWMPGSHTQLVEKLLKMDSDWHVPLLWRSEFRNVLTGYIRLKNISVELAIKIMEEAEKFFSGREYATLSNKVLKLVSKSTCSAYDCEFVALAEELGIPLITTDKKIITAFPKSVVSLQDFLDKK